MEFCWKNLVNGNILEITDKKRADYKIPNANQIEINLRLLFLEFEKQKIPRRIEINSQINIENRLCWEYHPQKKWKRTLFFTNKNSVQVENWMFVKEKSIRKS